MNQDIAETPEKNKIRDRSLHFYSCVYQNFEIINENKNATHLIVDVRGLAGRIERGRTQRTLKTDGRMADRTLTGSDGTRSRHGGSRLCAAAPRRLLLRLHLRGNQLRIRQRVSVFPQGTLYVSILSCYIHYVNSNFQQTHSSILKMKIVLRSVFGKIW